MPAVNGSARWSVLSIQVMSNRHKKLSCLAIIFSCTYGKPGYISSGFLLLKKLYRCYYCLCKESLIIIVLKAVLRFYQKFPLANFYYYACISHVSTDSSVNPWKHTGSLLVSTNLVSPTKKWRTNLLAQPISATYAMLQPN